MLTVSDNASTAAGPLQTSDRRCENPDCSVNKLISMVPKRKTTQFISDPLVIDKPMLVSGFTAVFQVDGSSARLMDIKNPTGDSQKKSIYRIMPNSHVHVVNYVVVDTDETYLKKITENDPATMQKLLTSQKESADQMLKKIMSGQGSSATAAMTTVVSTINNNSTITPQTAQPNLSTSPGPNVIGTNITQKNPIKFPVRMHPNLKITAVACSEAMNSPAVLPSSAPSLQPAPYITPVPLTNLQAPAPSTNNQSAPPVQLISPAINSTQNRKSVGGESVDKPTYDKMQAEINDLRRTVAMLAEAQAKNQQQSGNKAAKRPKLK